MKKIGLYVFGKNHHIDKYFQVLRLFDEMIKDERFTPILLTDGTSPAEKDILDKYSGVVRHVDLYTHDINQQDLSAVLIIDPYNTPIVPYDQIKVPIIYKEYGTAGVEKGTGFLLDKKIYQYASLIITENSYVKEMIKEKFPHKNIVIGSPAFDYIYDNVQEDLRFDPSMKHVLWTPHHSIVKSQGYDKIVGGTYSTFMTYKDYFAQKFLEEFPNVVLHIKPHPHLRGRYNYYYGGFSQYINSFKEGRMFLHEKEDYHNLFRLSDVIINDSISFMQEWIVTQKPMIVLTDNCKSKYSPYGEMIKEKCYYEVESEAMLSQCLHLLLESIDPKFNERVKVGDQLFNHPGSPNSPDLLNLIYNMY